jgi:hypothetical protein
MVNKDKAAFDQRKVTVDPEEDKGGPRKTFMPPFDPDPVVKPEPVKAATAGELAHALTLLVGDAEADGKRDKPNVQLAKEVLARVQDVTKDTKDSGKVRLGEGAPTFPAKPPHPAHPPHPAKPTDPDQPTKDPGNVKLGEGAPVFW